MAAVDDRTEWLEADGLGGSVTTFGAAGGTVRTICCPGATDRSTASPMAFSLTRAMKPLATVNSTSASSKASRTSRIASAMFVSEIFP